MNKTALALILALTGGLAVLAIFLWLGSLGPRYHLSPSKRPPQAVTPQTASPGVVGPFNIHQPPPGLCAPDEYPVPAGKPGSWQCCQRPPYCATNGKTQAALREE